MKITILYFVGCPNHPRVVELVRRVVAELGLDAEVEEVEVTSPEQVDRLRFLGSPTVHVDGVDIDVAARARTDFAMSCRLYGTPDGLPSRAMLLAALGVDAAHAGHAKSDRRDSTQHADCCDGVPAHAGVRAQGGRVAGIAAAGSIVTAMLSSACCWVPLLLLAFGASAAGISAMFAPWRPVFLAVAVAMLGLGFYLTYVRKPVTVAGCCATNRARRRRFGRATWWLSAMIVAGFVLFPQYGGRVLGSSPATHPSPSHGAGRQFVFQIQGMHCEACAVSLTADLARIEGVRGAQVDYATKTARLMASDDAIVSRVRDAASRLGYSAVLRPAAP